MNRWCTRLVALVAMATAFGLTACGGSKGTSDVVATTDTILFQDGVDPSDLPDGATTLDPGPRHECETDADCITAKGATFACDCEYKCIEVPDAKTANGCREDKNCGSEAYCDACTKTCSPLLPACATCDTDRQCTGQMSHCVDTITVAGLTTTLPQKVCAPWCPLSTGACAVEGAIPGTYMCALLDGDLVNGVCVPGNMNCGGLQARCEKDADCGQGEKCWLDLHKCGCRDALSCGFGQACLPTTHNCVDGCTADTECGSKKVCNAGLCQDACTGSLADSNIQGCDDPVPMEGKEWDCVKGHCSVPGMCFSPIDCRDPETYCDADTRTCKAGCLIDFDCKSASKLCDSSNKVCIDRGCDANFWCGCGQVCNLGQSKCETAVGKYCQVCDQQADDPCGDKDTLCIGFKDPKTNEDKGSYCMPPCGSDSKNPCPQGWQCQDVKDDKGVSQGKKCIRFCYQKVSGGCAMGDAPDPAAGDATPGEDTAAVGDP